MSKAKRILLYAVNGSGLGHVTRLLATGAWLRRFVTLLDGCPPEVFFLTSCDATEVIAKAGFAAFKIPSKTVIRQAEADPLEYRRLAKQFIWNCLGVLSPDLLVVDTFPSGNFDELFQILDGPLRKGFIFRNVKREFAERPIFRAALGLYDTIVVPHSRYSLDPRLLAPNVPSFLAGEIVQIDREEALPVEEARSHLGVAPGTKLVFVSTGGGGDPGSEAALHCIVEAIEGSPSLHALVAAGPLYRGRRKGGPRITWMTDPCVAAYMPACDAAISAGGYNTFHELLYFGVPTMFFAQEKIADDQLERIRAAEREGACVLLSDPSDGDEVSRLLQVLLDGEKAARMKEGCARILSVNGARQAARFLLTPLYGEPQLAWAFELLTPRMAHRLAGVHGSSSRIIGGWLPRLLPMVQALPALPAAIEAILPQLSPEARAEITALMSSGATSADREMFETALFGLLERMNGLDEGPEPAFTLIEVAMKKHPITQEPHRQWLQWVCDLLSMLTRLLGIEVPGLAQSEVLQAYRIFPRIIDADLESSFQCFRAKLIEWTDTGDSGSRILRRIQALKFAEQRVSRATLDSQPLKRRWDAGGMGEEA